MREVEKGVYIQCTNNGFYNIDVLKCDDAYEKALKHFKEQYDENRIGHFFKAGEYIDEDDGLTYCRYKIEIITN